ncbi:unnamed protein product [Phytomonas sp. Hart1]|nr:unnamed protein product [Phytomonas sp. Hart1]|eukprot:CCW72250.1 unnamed protein product [Phytomonas sp. isolate Hart1]
MSLQYIQLTKKVCQIHIALCLSHFSGPLFWLIKCFTVAGTQKRQNNTICCGYRCIGVPYLVMNLLVGSDTASNFIFTTNTYHVAVCFGGARMVVCSSH